MAVLLVMSSAGSAATVSPVPSVEAEEVVFAVARVDFPGASVRVEFVDFAQAARRQSVRIYL